jgi:hypothetical protein
MNGETPADWARMSGHDDMVALLEDSEKKDAVQDIPEQPQAGIEDSACIKTGEFVWQPSHGYFPIFYERRSGLGSLS